MTLRTITYDDEQWQVVPVEPTRKMLAYGWNTSARELAGARAMRTAWRAMLDVAPQPSEQSPQIVGWMVSIGDIETAAMYCLSRRENAFDAHRRWEGSSITALVLHPHAPQLTNHTAATAQAARPDTGESSADHKPSGRQLDLGQLSPVDESGGVEGSAHVAQIYNDAAEEDGHDG